MNTESPLFLRACRREPVERTPVWFMRQAGRYMPEYRAIRANHSFLEMVKTPDIAAQITLQPIAALPVDAAIIYSDILPPLEGMGLHLTYEQGEGPVIHNPVRSHADVLSLREVDARETMGFTLEAIRLVQRDLGGRIPLIGFSGAPFTLASYAIEGAGSREYRRTKLLMYRDPATWHLLMEKLSALVADYLIAQIQAGADAVQIFDSWAGALSPGDYAEYVLPYVRDVVGRVRQQTIDGGRWTIAHRQNSAVYGDANQAFSSDEITSSSQNQPSSTIHRPSSVPIIYFGTTMGGMGRVLRETGADVIGLDWRVSLDEGWERLGHDVAVQGNLDPAVLFAPAEEITRRAADILQRAGGRPGHIFNLGHGILTETPVDNVRRLAEFVREFSAVH